MIVFRIREAMRRTLWLFCGLNNRISWMSLLTAHKKCHCPQAIDCAIIEGKEYRIFISDYNTRCEMGCRPVATIPDLRRIAPLRYSGYKECRYDDDGNEVYVWGLSLE